MPAPSVPIGATKHVAPDTRSSPQTSHGNQTSTAQHVLSAHPEERLSSIEAGIQEILQVVHRLNLTVHDGVPTQQPQERYSTHQRKVSKVSLKEKESTVTVQTSSKTEKGTEVNDDKVTLFLPEGSAASQPSSRETSQMDGVQLSDSPMQTRMDISASNYQRVEATIGPLLRTVKTLLGNSNPHKHLKQQRADSHARAKMNRMRRFIRSSRFEWLSGLLTLVHLVFVCAGTQWRAEHGKDSWVIEAGLLMANVAIFVECLARAYASGSRYCKDYWNIFDAIMLVNWIADVALSAFPNAGRIATIVRLLRLSRIVRAVRLMRMTKFVRPLRKMLHALWAACATLVWAVILLLCFLLLFALVFVTGTNAYTGSTELGSSDQSELQRSLMSFYGSVPKSMYTLFLCISGGISWGEPMAPLALLDIEWFFVGSFLLYILFMTFGVLNILVAVFVDSAMQASMQDHEMRGVELREAKHALASKLGGLFADADEDRSGSICRAELDSFFGDEMARQILEAMGLEAGTSHQLFELLDTDGSGKVSVEEFIQGCLKTQGNASSFDLHCWRVESMVASSQLTDQLARIGNELSALRKGPTSRLEAFAAKPGTGDEIDG